MPNKQNAFRQSVISSETCIRTDGGKSNSKLRPTGKANSKDRDNDQQQLKNVAQPSQTKVKAFGNDYGVSRETKYKVTTKIRKK